MSTLGILDLLLVEDDVLAAQAIGGLLQGLGHTVRYAANGLVGISEMAARRPHLALLDLDLPGIDGLQVARLWRKRESENADARLPLVALTARSDLDIEQQVRAAGMDRLLRKPVDQAGLALMLNQMLMRPPLESPSVEGTLSA